ncbi:MAG TPA: hypothetical protein VHX88_05340 [Solirubrobacteraceae bacterium]|nr:hypothetical protein [Solirubrobacteraceae bacterium]
MTRAAAAVALLALGLTGCGGSSPSPAVHALAPPLARTLQVGAGTWATIPMGSASGANRFWELFWRPAPGAGWTLVTPPGVADNGGLDLAPGSAFLVGFLPSFNLRFSPLASTADDGRTWTPGVLPAGLASAPDALAVGADGATAALTAAHRGTVLLEPHGGGWTTLATARSLAALAAARRCGLDELGAVAFAASGALLVGGSCAHAGEIALYAHDSAGWRNAAPPLPRSLARRDVSVLSLSQTATTTFVLLDLTGATHALEAAWSTDGGRRWQQTDPLPLPNGSRLLASGSGPGATTYVLAQAKALLLDTASPRTDSWLALPAPPSGAAAVALGTSDDHALVVHGSVLADWQLDAGARAWREIGSAKIPIQYGSSS